MASAVSESWPSAVSVCSLAILIDPIVTTVDPSRGQGRHHRLAAAVLLVRAPKPVWMFVSVILSVGSKAVVLE